MCDGLKLSKIAHCEGEVRMRMALLSVGFSLLMLTSGGCAPATQEGPAASVGPDRIPRITALYEHPSARPVHPFRKPARDEQNRARRELQAECQRWLADLRAEAVPTALTGADGAKSISPAADMSSLQFSLEQLSSAAGTGDPAALRAAHARALAAYRQLEGASSHPASHEN